MGPNGSDTKNENAAALLPRSLKGRPSLARKLSPTQRREMRRWPPWPRWSGHAKPVKALHSGDSRSVAQDPVRVLEDGTRVLSSVDSGVVSPPATRAVAADGF